MQQVERIYFMDSMRGVLMILGVVLHSAQVFNPAQIWLIYSQDSTSIAGALVYIIHVFRMPAFFVISGFFCVFTIQKYGADRFIRLRLVRIGIPLLATAVILNTIQTAILVKTGWKPFVLSNYLLEGRWVSHLWFLINLIAYFIGAFILARFLAMPIYQLGTYLVRLLLAIPITIILLFMPLLSIGILAIGKLGFPLYANLFGVLDIYSIMKYLPYFIFGALLGINYELRLRFSTVNPIICLSILLVTGFVNYWFSWPANIIGEVVDNYLYALQAWVSIVLFFYVFHRLFNVKSRISAFFSDASYSIYLFHHVLVVGLGLVIIEVGIGGLAGMLMLIAIVVLITVGIHYFLISRIKILRFLFNGK